MIHSRDVVISGCSGGGKSTLLTELASRGFATMPEPGRRIVQEELRGAGRALPWIDIVAFAERALEIAAEDRERSSKNGTWIFFDRGLVDAAVALEHATGRSAVTILAGFQPYHSRVFLTPPWPEIYESDAERPHTMEEAIAEYERLTSSYQQLGYEVIVIPKMSVAERATFVLEELR